MHFRGVTPGQLRPVDDVGRVPSVPQHHGVLLRSTAPEGVFVGSRAIAEGRITRRGLAEGPHVRVLHGV